MFMGRGELTMEYLLIYFALWEFISYLDLWLFAGPPKLSLGVADFIFYLMKDFLESGSWERMYEEALFALNLPVFDFTDLGIVPDRDPLLLLYSTAG